MFGVILIKVLLFGDSVKECGEGMDFDVSHPKVEESPISYQKLVDFCFHFSNATFSAVQFILKKISEELFPEEKPVETQVEEKQEIQEIPSNFTCLISSIYFIQEEEPDIQQMLDNLETSHALTKKLAILQLGQKLHDKRVPYFQKAT
jgi:hypothetical protein